MLAIQDPIYIILTYILLQSMILYNLLKLEISNQQKF